ncbi:lytic transglycosylase domain-containing protein [Candidatus Venteria ishoeyi]|uniref:Soluble lytic murein transglycosylase n=1 Tax=Candidatus Venteria ishoeyi TaxID=1899563 RepID=A0A1H6F3D3_9GAMM|nr:lytic transglycosylase domain-containing protein [Candidatus Venteria ishoeyi]MDM8545417.1 lytic transglycosylase domain-containing protein [Candidatus Venteria ishoeyi]SEH04630.1 Soluble lytic murein transglycosylase precursor [Candidatus Venteria ishoeyi]
MTIVRRKLIFTILLLFIDTSVLASDNKRTAKAQKMHAIKLLADKIALKHDIHPDLFRALIFQESSWRPKVVSSMGAIGLTQVMPATAKALCKLNRRELYEPAKNLECGAKYFASQIKRFNSVEMALCAYNAGPSLVARLGRCPNIRVTKAYARKIQKQWREKFWANKNPDWESVLKVKMFKTEPMRQWLLSQSYILQTPLKLINS